MTPASNTSTTSMRAFGLLLKRSRRAAHLTQAQLAERAGFSVVYISMLERGARQPQRSTVALLADALALSPAERATLEAAAPLPSPRAGGAARTPGPPTGAFLGATPLGLLVGRKIELARIEDALEAVVQRQGRFLALSGEPGIGKTRLAQEITVRARAQGFHVLTGRCYKPQQTVAWYPFLEALAMAAEGIGGDARSALEAQWPEVARLLPDHPAYAQTPAQINDRAAQQRLFWQMTSLLRALADQAPLALLLDDLHWADGASLDLLQHLARHTRDRRILLVLTYRDSEVNHALAAALHDLGRDELVEWIAVRPLSGDETTTLIGSTLGAGEGAQAGAVSVSPQLARLIQQRSEGNALFTRQLTRALQEQGNLRWEGGEWRMSANTPPRAPESVRAVIGQRLARLTSLTQDIVREASVLGQAFAFADLQRMSNRGEQEVEEALEEAARAGIVREGEHDRYHFNHALTLDTLYADLSTRRKRRLHRAAATAIERLPEHERRAAEIARHLLAADEVARALPYALLAGDQAEAVYAHAEAESSYRTALALALEHRDQESEAQAREKLGVVLSLVGRNDEAIALLDGALRRYESLKNEQAELRALAALLEIQGLYGREMTDEATARAQAILARLEPPDTSTLTPERASGLAAVYRGLTALTQGLVGGEAQGNTARRAAELARLAGDEAQLAWALHRLYASGLVPDHIAARQEILAMAERSGQTIVVVWSHNMISFFYMAEGEFTRALAHQEQSVAVAEQRQDLLHLAWQLSHFTHFLHYTGDWRRMRETYARAEAILCEADRDGATWQAVVMSAWPGTLALLEGREEDGRRLLEPAIERIHAFGSDWAAGLPIRLLAEADLLAGHAEQAHSRLATYLQSSRLSVDQDEVWRASILLAWAEASLGQLDEGWKRLTSVLATAKPLYRVDALRAQGFLAIMQEHWDVAAAAFDEALASARAMPYPYAEAKALWAYGQLEVARGDPTAARERFEQALTICDQLGEGLYRKQIEHDLAALRSLLEPIQP